MAPPTNWTSFGESPFPWERDALDFVRAGLPAREPYRAWSLFEFIALDGSVNEVDLLVYAPYGFFLIEIKSHPGTISGDGGTWLWENDGRRSSFDNPLKLANLKAKRLASLLGSQNAFRRGSKRVPFIEPLVFLSAPDVNCNLTGTGRLRVCLRDVGDPAAASSSAEPSRAGIIAAICQRNCPGLQPLTGRPPHDRPMAKLVTRAIDEAGIRQSQRQRRVSDYILDEQIDDGPAFQDWLAHHASLPDVKRRVRIFPLQGSASAEARQRHQRAAIRDYQLQESLRHDRVLRALQYTDHELGPAIISPEDVVDNPAEAQAGDILDGGWVVIRRLGQGSCAVALLASHCDKRIVEYVDTAEIGGFQGFLMRPAYSDRSSRRIETLGGRLRKQGRLNAELLERFGERAKKPSKRAARKTPSACVCCSMAVRTEVPNTLANSLCHSGGATQSESMA